LEFILSSLLLLTAIGFLPGGSVQYTSTKKHKHYIRRKTKQTYNTITTTEKIKSNHTEQKTNTRQVIQTYKTIR
jgi:hypothetical protein